MAAMALVRSSHDKLRARAQGEEAFANGIKEIASS
jgi:hypothetical protein